MTLSEFIKFNHDQGLNWFSPDAMRFFGTRISNWDGITGLFITSEEAPHSSRLYSVRQAHLDTGRVTTLGVFMGHKTLAQARAAMERYAKMDISERGSPND